METELPDKVSGVFISSWPAIVHTLSAEGPYPCSNAWLPGVFMQLGFETHSVIALLAMRSSAGGGAAKSLAHT